MIELTLTELAAAVLGSSMLLVLLLIAVSRQRAAKGERRSLQHRITCRLCLAVFEATSRDAVQTCPECGAKTNRRGPRPLG